MRVAIIGLPGTGKTTLTAVLARELGASTPTTVEELPSLLEARTPFVLDGFPSTLDDLRDLHRIERLVASGQVLDRVVWLRVDNDVRTARMRRSAAATGDTAAVAGLGSQAVDLIELADELAREYILIPIDAGGSEYKVMALVFEALGIRI